jgi:hypothetical protein
VAADVEDGSAANVFVVAGLRRIPLEHLLPMTSQRVPFVEEFVEGTISTAFDLALRSVVTIAGLLRLTLGIGEIREPSSE